jgi:ATP-dependent DNA helicase PIF1
MNTEQQDFVRLAYAGHNIFLTGEGGTGKSYVIQHLVDKYKAVNKSYALTSMTGCAALLLGRAKTLHSWAGVGLARESAAKLIEIINASPRKKRTWISTEVLIVDEVSMLDVDFFEKLDAIGQAIRKNPKPFGGIQLIFVGDFFQLPPVDTGTAKFIFESALWSKIGFKVVELTKVIRQKDPVFHKILKEARLGILSQESFDVLKTRTNLPWSKLEIKPTILFPKKDIVANVNVHGLSKLPGPEYTYKVQTICSKRGDDLTFASQKALRNASYDETLVLKVGAQVMLLINKNDGTGLVNGSRGVVTSFLTNSTPLVKFHSMGQAIPIEKHTWEIEGESMSQTQLPLKLAYALSIHKSQGATLDSALIDIGTDIFEYGQAYVALSRVKSLDCLYINRISAGAFKANPKVKIFYDELELQDETIMPNPVVNLLSNKGKAWSDEEVMGLLKSIRAKKSIESIALEHRRTEGSIRSRLRQIAADYYFNNNMSIEDIKKYTGLSEISINDIITRRQVSGNHSSEGSL